MTNETSRLVTFDHGDPSLRPTKQSVSNRSAFYLLANIDEHPEVLPMALLRPLSGSGAFGVMSETLVSYGPDSFIGLLTSTLQGSTETTFYVLALYFGAARITDGRHALAACLIGDLAGFAGAVAACHWFFG